MRIKVNEYIYIWSYISQTRSQQVKLLSSFWSSLVKPSGSFKKLIKIWPKSRPMGATKQGGFDHKITSLGREASDIHHFGL